MRLVRVQWLNLGNSRNDETIGSFRTEVLSERLNINQILLCRWIFWLHVRLVNRGILVSMLCDKDVGIIVM